MATSLVDGLGGGVGFGENYVPGNDDDYTGFIDLHAVFPDGLNMFGHVYTGLYVNNNGSVTFEEATGTYTPEAITGTTSNPIIAPFWADVDTRGGASAPTPGGTSRGSDLVWYDQDSATHTFTATWDDVGYYSGHIDKVNAFQLQLIGVPDSDGNYSGDFDIVFRYEALNWVTGDASGGEDGLGGTVARAGYSSGNGINYFELPQSGDQAAMLDLTNASNVGVAGTYVFSVRNGAATASISTTDVRVAEGNGDPVQYAVVAIQLAAPASDAITVAYATADGSAIAGQDYIAQRGVLTFAPGVTQQNVYVEIVGDTTAEPDESFALNLSDASGAPITVTTSTVTIVNDDGLSVSDVTAIEGSGGGTTPFVFTVTLLTAQADAVTVNYSTVAGTATAGSDFTPVSGALTFAAGQTQQTVTVDVVADSAVEGDETFALHLSNASGSQIAKADGIGTIVNDDGVVVDDVSVVEGTGNGSTTANVVLRLLSAQSNAVTVNWATQGDNAISGTDFTASSGTATFAPGQTQVVVQVPVTQDSLVEGNESFTIGLSNVVGSAIVDDTGTVTIVDDDGFVIGDASALEGTGGSNSISFTVTLQSALPTASTVDYTTMDGTATAGSDYTAISGQLTFAAGQTSQTITVPITTDATPEADETFAVQLSSPSANAGIADGTAQGLIVNDDGLSINDASTYEGDSGTKNVVLAVTLSDAAAVPVTVDWTTVDGTANAGSDYSAASGTLTFAAGQTEQDITLSVNGDTVWEADESFRVVLSNPSNSAIVDGSGSVVILNDDTRPPPALSVISTQQTEGTGAGTTTTRFVVGLSYASDSDTTVDYATSDGSAAAGSDYTAQSGTLTIAAGSLYGTIEVPVVRDAVVEPDESFTVTLSNPSDGVGIAGATATGTIINDDTQISVAAVSPSEYEGDSGSTPFNFVVSRTGDTSQAQTVAYAVTEQGVPAVAAGDFTGAVLPSGVFTFAPGQASGTLEIGVAGDTIVEPNDDFTLTLSNPSGGATLGTASASMTILNDDAGVDISGAGLFHTEGASGNTAFAFILDRSGATLAGRTVDWTVSGFGANSATGSDFPGGVFPSGTVTFAAGESNRLVVFNVAGDTTVEPDETFLVTLSNPGAGLTITTATATGTIQNDDAQVSIAATSASQPEGDSGSTPFTFTVTRSGDLSVAQSVGWAVAGSGGSPASDADFVGGAPPSGTVSFAAGVASQTITVAVAGDTAVEADEGFSVTLSGVASSDPTHSLTIGTATAAGTILNDDSQLAIAALDASKAEGNSGSTAFTFTVTRTGNLADVSSAAWSVVGLAPASANPADFVGGAAPAGTVSFAAGESSKTITVNVAGDTLAEPDEGFQVVLSQPVGTTVAGGAATATIVNDDTNYAVASTTGSAPEGNSGSTGFVFTVTRSGAVGGSGTVGWTVIGFSGASANAADFVGGTAPSGTVTFAAGEVSRTLTVAVQGDTLVEPDEGFQVVLTGPVGGTVVGGGATATILNDDTSLSVAATDASKAEGKSGSTPFVFTVTRAGNLSGASRAAWAVVGLAPASANPADFVGGVVPSGTVSFAAGESSRTITVNVAGDTLAEADEHFQVVLSRPVGATVAVGSAAATIVNDDTNFAIASTTGSHLEGNSGATPFVFTVTRSGIASGANSVAWSVVGALPNSAGPSDFVGGAPPSGTLSFAAGVLSQTLTVNVAGDTALEPDEYFQVVLGQTTGGATIATGSALGKIVNDDTGFSIAATDAVKAEGNSGPTALVFTVTRSGNIGGTHAVAWQVSGALPNTAGPGDFVGGVVPSGGLVFTQGEVSKTLTVEVQGDTTVEADEHFTVLLHNPTGGAAILVGHAEGSILNDDGGVPADIAGSLATVATADFNGDGTADLLRQAPGGDLYVLNGASGVQGAVSQAAAGLSFVAAADFGGDGRADILLQGGGGGLYAWTMAGAQVQHSDLVTVLSGGQTVAGVADYTGDGRADILLANAPAQAGGTQVGGSGGWTLLAMQDGTVASSTNLASLPDAWHVG